MVDTDDIAKHRNDIIRLGLTLTLEQSFAVPPGIRRNLIRFFNEIEDDLPQDDFIKRAGASGITVPEVIVRIKEAFGL